MSFPANAKKVFQGEIFSVYQWPQEMYDGTVQTFEKLKRPDTAIVIATTSEGKFLVAKQSQPSRPEFWGLFGGRIEEGEAPIEGARRELLEESGYTSENIEEYFHIQPYHKMDWTSYVFIAKNCQKTTQPNLDAGEKIEVFEYTFEEFIKLCCGEEFREKELQYKVMKAIIEGKREEIKKLFIFNSKLK